MSDAEYITEWPPPSFKEEGIPASKRPKLELSDHEPDGSGESSHRFIQSSFSNKADVLLARWWKEKAKCKEGSLLKADIKSTNPNTILFHISRYTPPSLVASPSLPPSLPPQLYYIFPIQVESSKSIFTAAYRLPVPLEDSI